MSNDKKKKGGRGQGNDNIVQFPGRKKNKGPNASLSGSPEELLEGVLPGFLEQYLPISLEFASITAVEIMNYASETLEHMKKGAIPRELLDVLFIKLRGLSIIVPSVDIIALLADLVGDDDEDYPDFLYVRDIIEDSIDAFEELLEDCTKGQPVRPSRLIEENNALPPIPVNVFKKHNGEKVIEGVHDTAEEMLMELGNLAEHLFVSDDE